jgi:type IV pilus assembly protein PilP
VVRKKVVAQKEQTAKVRTKEAIRTSRTTDAASQPKVVRKKVVAQKEQTAKVRTNQTVHIAKLNQAARLEKKTAAIKTDKSQIKAQSQAVPKTKTDRQTLGVKKVEVTSARDIVMKPAQPKKPAVRPISDISEIKQPSTDDSAAPSDKLIAATSNVTPKARSAAIPGAYDATGKIDPFEPLFREKPVFVKKPGKKPRIRRTPLERIDLSQLKLVGIILASSGNRALVEESSGKGYVIKKGTYIGVNYGKVVKIKKEKVIVEEEFEDVFGKSKLRQREIKLPKPPGEF